MAATSVPMDPDGLVIKRTDEAGNERFIPRNSIEYRDRYVAKPWQNDWPAEDRDAPPETIQPYVAPPPVIPQTVTARQARRALLAAGLLDQANAAVAASNNQAMQIDWDFAAEIYRNSAWIGQLASALNLNDAAVDALFTSAAAYE
jgi:hypothetical protein